MRGRAPVVLPAPSIPQLFTTAEERDAFLAAQLNHRTTPLVLSAGHDVLYATREAALHGRDRVREFFYSPRDGFQVSLHEPVTYKCFGAYENPLTGWVQALPHPTDVKSLFPGLWWPSVGTLPASRAVFDVPPWAGRTSVCGWRGGATGAGHTSTTNIRLRACQLSTPGVLDAQLTGTNSRRLKASGLGDGSYGWTERGVAPASKSNFLSMQEQAARFKYMLVLDGNTGADRIGAALATGCALIIPVSALTQTDVFALMERGVHYMQCAHDLSDLLAVITELQRHDDTAQRLGEEGRALWEQHMTLDAMAKRTRSTIMATPEPDTAEFCRTFDYLWSTERTAAWCAVDTRTWTLLAFVPFCNEQFRNNMNIRTNMRRALAEPGVIPDPRSWWTNGPLICNVESREPPFQGDAHLIPIIVLLQSL